MKHVLLAALAIAMLAGCQNQQREAQQGQEGQAAAGGAGAMQQERGATGDAQQQRAQQQMAMGTITEVQDDQITVRTSGGEQMELTLEENAQIMMNGQPIQRDRLQQGASVRAAYREEGGEMRVERLEVQSMGAGQQPGAQPSEQPGGMQGQQQQPGAQP